MLANRMRSSINNVVSFEVLSIQGNVDGTDQNDYLWQDLSVPNEDPSRYLVVAAISWISTGVGGNCDEFEIDNNTMTELQRWDKGDVTGSSYTIAMLGYYAFPTGTTCDFKFGTDGQTQSSTSFLMLEVRAPGGIALVDADAESGQTSPSTQTISLDSSSSIILHLAHTAADDNHDFSNLTERFDTGDGNDGVAGAWDYSQASGSFNSQYSVDSGTINGLLAAIKEAT